MASQTTIKTLRQRVERLNEKLGRELELSSHSAGRRGRVYHLHNEKERQLDARGGFATEMDYFLDGVFAGLRLATPDPDAVRDVALENIEVNTPHEVGVQLNLTEDDVAHLGGDQ